MNPLTKGVVDPLTHQGSTEGAAKIPATFRDGTSNTIMFAESYANCVWNDHPDFLPSMIMSWGGSTTSYRPQLLRVLRDKQVHATFWDLGVRAQANPQWPRYQVHEGHVELSHAFNHVHMDQLTPAADEWEVEHNANVLATIGAPLTFKGIRPPFGGSSASVQKLSSHSRNSIRPSRLSE